MKKQIAVYDDNGYIVGFEDEKQVKAPMSELPDPNEKIGNSMDDGTGVKRGDPYYINDKDSRQNIDAVRRHRWNFFSEEERDRAERELSNHFGCRNAKEVQSNKGLILFHESLGDMRVLGMEWFKEHEQNARKAKWFMATHPR